jgi:flagellar basal body-associated protein FliL
MDLKKILMMGGMALALGVGGVAMKCGGEGEAEAGEEGEEGHEAPPPSHEKPKAGGHEKPKGHGAAAAEDDGDLVVAKQIHVVNMPGVKSGFLRCQFSFFVRDADLGKQMTSETPTADMEEAKSIVLGILRALSAEEVNEPEAQEALRLDIMDRLNDRFGGSPSSDKALPPRHREPIKDVFITEWAVQR